MKNFLYLFLVLLTFSCQNSDKKEKPLVIVSIAPYSFFVKKIAQETVQVKILVPPNANPHNFEPSPDQTALLSKALIWFKIGEGFEKKAALVLKGYNPSLEIYDLRQNIELISPKKHCHADLEDRHIWLSPPLAKIQARTIASALINGFPENSALYEENLKKFLNELDDLDAEIKTILENTKESIIVSHPTFTYFCKEYGVNQIIIEGVKELGSKQTSRALRNAHSKKNACVFVQPQYNNKAAILVAKKLRLLTTKVDPYSTDYINTLRFVAQTIANNKKNEIGNKI